MTPPAINRRQAILGGAALTMGAAVVGRAEPARRPDDGVIARWKLVDPSGRVVGFRLVMTRAAWEAIPYEARYNALPDDSGTVVLYDHIFETNR